MPLGLFDVVGPIMHGPSSSHTAGANRIGFMAGKIMGEIPQSLRFGFQQIYYQAYAGQKSHVALTAGCIGYREDDERSLTALDEARKGGVVVSCYSINEEKVHRNTMRVNGTNGSQAWEINGISVGGGNILIDRINQLEVALDGNDWYWLMNFSDQQVAQQAEAWLVSAEQANLLKSFSSDIDSEQGFYCGVFRQKPQQPLPVEIQNHLIWQRLIEPLYPFREVNNQRPLFTNFTELLKESENKPLLDVVLLYESLRSGQSQAAVLQEAARLVQVCRLALQKGTQEEIELIGGFCSGRDGKTLAAYATSGHTLMGEGFNLAMARAVMLAEMNGAMGKIVAAPTGGAAGTLPAVLLTVAERLNCSEAQLAQAFLVAAAIGVVIGNQASFSGAVGGCQGEIGIAAAMAAGGAAWLGQGSAATVINAAVLALKNVLGLTCDPPASPVEVPCIKRNAMGAAVGLMGAELALAGINSVIDPDDVVLALVDTQRRLPSELKGSCGGLAATTSGAGLRQAWTRKLQDLEA